jgi:hypothetical protein
VQQDKIARVNMTFGYGFTSHRVQTRKEKFYLNKVVTVYSAILPRVEAGLCLYPRIIGN